MRLSTFIARQARDEVDANTFQFHLLLHYVHVTNTSAVTDGYVEVHINDIILGEHGFRVLIEFITNHGTKKSGDKEWHDDEWLAHYDVDYDFDSRKTGAEL